MELCRQLVAVFPSASASSEGTWLWRLDGTTWNEVLQLSSETGTKADAKSIGNIVHILLYDGSPELVSVEYVGGTYQLWSVRPASSAISLPNSEIATIDVDSTGRMWLASESGTDIVAYYSDSPYSTWSGPIVLATGVSTDDIAAVVALPTGMVGVFWSDQNAQRFGFRVHVDGADPSIWASDEVPASQSALNVGLGMADDHMNAAIASDGTLYMAVKTSYDTSGYPKIALLVRRPTGIWDDLYDVDSSGTRGIVLLDETESTLKVIYTSSEGNNDIVYKQTALSPIAFGSLQTLRSGGFNDVSSTKQTISNEFVTIFYDGSNVQGMFCSSTLSTGADLSITKDDGQTTATPGMATTYTIVVANSGSEDATGATVTDLFGSDLTNVTWTCSATSGANCAASGSGNINDTVDLPAGSSVTYQVSATIDAGASGTLANTASVAPPDGLTDPVMGNNTDTDTTSLPGGSCGSDPTLVGCWLMEEGSGSTIIDSSGSGNDGALSGDPAWTTGVNGMALALDGSGDYALVPDDASLDLANQLTLAAWIQPANSGTQYLVKKATQSGVDGYELSLASSGKIFTRLNQDTSGNTYRIDSTSDYSTDGSTWMHVAATYDGTTLRLYVDGQEENSMAATITIATNSLPLGIGTQSDGGSPLQGNLDEVRVYNRALSESEIQTLADLSPSVTADLSITKDDGQLTATPGMATTYTIVVANSGPEDATNATVTDLFGSDLTNVNWTCSSTNGGVCTASGSGNINDTVDLPAGSSVTYQVTATIDAGASGTLANTASVAPPDGLTDPITENNTDTDTTVLTDAPCGSDPALVGCWLMEEGSGSTLIDSSGSGNDGALSGNPAWTTGVNGQALALDGSGDYALVPDDASLDIANQLTLAAWIQPANSGTQYVVKKATQGGVDGYELSLASSGKIFTRLNQSTSGNGIRIDSTSDYPTDGSTWMHVAATYDGATLRLYVNGVEESSLSTSIPIATNTLPLGIGAQSDGDSSLEGNLDEVRVYNRALSVTEIQVLAGLSPSSTADLSITKDDSRSSIAPGDPVTYTITVVNNGPDDVVDAAVADTFSTELTGINWTCTATNGGACAASGSGSLTDTPDLPSGSSAIYTVTATFDSAVTVPLVNTATVTVPAGMTDPNPDNNSATDINVLQSWADQCGNDPTLVGCWPMEEGGGTTLYDASSYGNHGVIYGSPSWQTAVDGLGLLFNGTTDYALIPDAASLDLATGKTISVWVKAEKQDTQYLVKKAINNGTPGLDDGYELSLASINSSQPVLGDGKAFARINQATSGNAYRLNSVTQYPYDGNTWIHLAITYDNNHMRFYYNGVEEAVLSTTVTIATNDLPLGIGAQSNGTVLFDGQLDDVRIYDRALSPSEVETLAGITYGTLKVVKDVDPDAPGTNWDIDVSGPTPFTDTLSGDDETSVVSVLTGVYTVIESAGASTIMSEYSSNWACTVNGSVGPLGSGATFTVTIGTDENMVCTFTNSYIDTTPPVITLVGDNPLVLEVGATYSDPGATATDNVDGDLTSQIVVGGDTVNTSVIGDYFVTYDVSDSSANPAQTVTRTVQVGDTTPPVITLVGDNPLVLEVGATYSDPGATATDNVDGDLTSQIVVGGDTVNTSVIGDYFVTYDVSDSSANPAQTVTRTVQVGDTTPPVITLVGDNPLVLEVGATYSDPGATATDNVDGDLTSQIVVGGDTVNTSVIGDYFVTYDVSDSSANPAQTVTRTVQVGDTTPPVITLVGDNPLVLRSGRYLLRPRRYRNRQCGR